MKFIIGERKYEKPRRVWHEWYAWRPVIVADGDHDVFVWFAKIQRKGTKREWYDGVEAGVSWDWEYKL